MNRQNLLISILLITVFALYLIKIILTIETSTFDIEIYSLSKEVKKLEVENSNLIDSILHETSLRTIKKKALEQGFIFTDFIYL